MEPAANRPTTNDVAAGSPDRFGFEWGLYSELRPEHEEQFRRWTVHLAPKDWKGRSFLDLGCGMGRNSYWPFRYGAARGVAIDLDLRSVSATRRTLAEFPAASVAVASAYDLPCRDEFDIVFSIGVIHHLSRPERALAEMVRAARPGGRVLVWVYGRENNEWIVRFVSPLRRALLSRVPVGALHALSIVPTGVLWLGLRLGLGWTEYAGILGRCSFPHLRSIVFDQLLPRIAHYWPRATVEQLLTDAGLEDVQLAWVNQVSWSAIGRKPGRGSGGH